MIHPGEELQTEIYAALVADTELSALLGPGRIYDDVPPKLKPPYVTFGKSLHFDWSTGSEGGMEHEIELHAWTRENGRKEIFRIQEILITLLPGLGGIMTSHNLVNLTHEQSQIEARDKYQAFLGTSLFRAVTEPIS